MIMKIIKINTDKISDWDSFHDTFKNDFGFPNYYGRNMDAWIDCMDDFLTEVTVIDFGNCQGLKIKCPEIIESICECSAFINYRRIDLGENPVLIISMYT
jgi:RNAse (barnase) inhibitor barstar